MKGSLDVATKTLTIADSTPAEVLGQIGRARKTSIDNLWSIALTAYHRYQVPRELGITTWNQFLKPDGTPAYPQRPVVGPLISGGAAGGGKFTGVFQGKMIVISNLLDVDAFSWHGDWYARRVRANLGESFDARFRLWFNDNADHLDGRVIASGNPDTENVRLMEGLQLLTEGYGVDVSLIGISHGPP